MTSLLKKLPPDSIVLVKKGEFFPQAIILDDEFPIFKITSHPSSGKSKLYLYKFDIAIGSASKIFGLNPAFLIYYAVKPFSWPHKYPALTLAGNLSEGFTQSTVVDVFY